MAEVVGLDALESGQVEALQLLAEQGWTAEAAAEVVGVSAEAARAVLPESEPLAAGSEGVRGMAWPPPLGPGERWVERSFVVVVDGVPREEARSVRFVLLWGRHVWVEESGAVFCPAHRRFEPVGELARFGNRCPVGPGVAERVLFEVSEAEMGAETSGVSGDGSVDVLERLRGAW